MKKYLSLLILLFCSCAFIFHGEGNEEEWANAYKISLENIEKKNWDLVALDGEYFAVFKTNIFEKEEIKLNKNSRLLITSMFNYPKKGELSPEEINKSLINSIPCILIVNNIKVNPKNEKQDIIKLKSLKTVLENKNNVKFIKYLNSFLLEEDMFLKFNNDFIEIYNKNKTMILDKSINFHSYDATRLEELNIFLIEKGYSYLKENPLSENDFLGITYIRSIIEQSEKYYQLGYKYPCFECSL